MSRADLTLSPISGEPLSREQAKRLSPRSLRTAVRAKRWTMATGGLAAGAVQANLVTLPREDAVDFLAFCHQNPKPCPVIDILTPGTWEARSARDSDVRTDLPRYRVFVDGEVVDEPFDIREWWRDELVTILLGCSATFEARLLAHDLPVRHLEEDGAAPMYITQVPCTSAGRFHGPLVVTMRPMPGSVAARAVELTAPLTEAHGAPIHIGDPAALGIDIDRPDFGACPTVRDGDVLMFWACGVTPQVVAVRSRASFMITHYPGCMFVTDRRIDLAG